MRKLFAFFAVLLVAASVGASSIQADANVGKVVLYNSSAFVSKSADVSTSLGEQTVTFSIPQSADEDTLLIIDDGADIVGYSVGVSKEDRDSLILRILKENPDELIAIVTEHFSIKAEIEEVVRDKYIVVSRPEFIDDMSDIQLNQLHRLFMPISLIQAVSFLDAPDFEGLEDLMEKTVSVKEDVSAKNRELTASYFVSNASWKPNYQLFLTGNETGKLYYWAKAVNNTKEDWEGVDLTIVAGQPNMKYSPGRYYGYGENYMMESVVGAATGAGVDEGQFDVSESQEYHVYELDRKISIPGKSTSYVPVLVEYIAYEKVYDWDARGRVYEDKMEGVVKYSVKFDNEAGEPLAAGWVSVYSDGLYVGGNNTAWVADGDEVELYLAPALDIKAEKFEEVKTSETPEATFTEYRYTLHLENHKNGDVVVTVKDNLPSNARDFKRNLDPSKMENNEVEWDVKIKAGGEQNIVYSYGTIYYSRY